MTNDEMRIAIAESLGWRQVGVRSHYHPERKNQSIHGEHEWWLCGFAPNQNILSEPPDFPNDLNAMHEAEKSLSTRKFRDVDNFEETERSQYCSELEHVITAQKKWSVFECYNAEAPQRCEAYLRVKGLWKP